MKKSFFELFSKLVNPKVVPEDIKESESATVKLGQHYINTYKASRIFQHHFGLEFGNQVHCSVREQENIPVNGKLDIYGSLECSGDVLREILSPADPVIDAQGGVGEKSVEFMHGLRYLPIRLELFTKDGLPVFFTFHRKKIATVPEVVCPGNEQGRDDGNRDCLEDHVVHQVDLLD